MSRRFLSGAALLLAAMLFPLASVDSSPFSKAVLDEPAGAMKAELSGVVTIVTRTEKPGFVIPETLVSASIAVGTMEIMIDCTDREDFRDQLLLWSVPRSGGEILIQPHAVIVGRIEFRPAKEVGGMRKFSLGIAPETPVPVIIPETMKLSRIGNDGQPVSPTSPDSLFNKRNR